MKTDTTTRSDLDALTALNRDYIHSVQHGDVRRFDEILAEDFLCSNPDGSLVDRKQLVVVCAVLIWSVNEAIRSPLKSLSTRITGVGNNPMT